VRRQVDHVAFLLDREIYLIDGRVDGAGAGGGDGSGNGNGGDVNSRSREEERSFEEEEMEYKNYTIPQVEVEAQEIQSSYFPSSPTSNSRIRRPRTRTRVVRFSEEVIEYTAAVASSTFDPYYSHSNSNSYGSASGNKYTSTTRKLFKDEDKVQEEVEGVDVDVDVDEFGNAHAHGNLEDWNHKDPSTHMDILDLSFESAEGDGDGDGDEANAENDEQEPDSSFETYFSDLSINASMNVSVSPVRSSASGKVEQEDLEELERALQDENDDDVTASAGAGAGAGAGADAENVIGFSDFNTTDFNINANHPEDFFANTAVDDGWEHFGSTSGSNSNTPTGDGHKRVEGGESGSGTFDEMEWPDVNDMHMHMNMHYEEDEPSSEYEQNSYEHEDEDCREMSGEKSNETSVTGSESNSEGISMSASMSISASSSDSAYSYSYENSHAHESSHEHEVSHNSNGGGLSSSSMWENEHDHDHVHDTSHNTNIDSMDRDRDSDHGGYIHRGDVDEYIYDHDEDVDEHDNDDDDDDDDDEYLNDHYQHHHDDNHEVPTQKLRPVGPIPICVSEMERSMDMIIEESYEEDDSFEVEAGTETETDRDRDNQAHADVHVHVHAHEEGRLDQSSIVYDVDEEIDGIGIGMDAAHVHAIVRKEGEVESTMNHLNLDVSNSQSLISSNSNGDDDLSVPSSPSLDEHTSHETGHGEDDSDLDSGVSFDSEEDDERSISFEVNDNDNENFSSFVEKIARENDVRAIHNLQEGGDDDSAAADGWAQEEQFQHKQQHQQQECDAHVEDDHDHCDNDYFAQRGDMKTDFRTPMEVEEALRASVSVSTTSDHSHSHHRIRSAASASADVDVHRNLIEEPVIKLYSGEEKKEQHRHGHRKRSRSPSSKISDLNAFMADTSLHGEAISLDYSSSLDFSFTSSKNHLSVSDEWDSTEIELEAPGERPVDVDGHGALADIVHGPNVTHSETFDISKEEDFDNSIIAESPEDFRFEEDCQSDDDTEHTEYVSKMTELEFNKEDDTDETLSDPCDSSGGDKTITTMSTADTGGMTSGSDHSSSDHGKTSCKKGIPDTASTEPQKKIGDELDLLESKMKELKEKKENMAREALPEDDSSHTYNENANERCRLRLDAPTPILMKTRVDSQNRTSVKSMMKLSSSAPSSLVDGPSKNHQAEETSEQRGMNNLSRRMHPTAARLKVLKQSAAWKRRHARQNKD